MYSDADARVCYVCLTCVIRGWVHLLLMPLCCSHWFSGWGQCCLRVQRFSPLHQTHPNSGSAFRHKPQLPLWASHLYRWTAHEGRMMAQEGRKRRKRDEQTSVQMITELRMHVKLSREWASKMMDKHTQLTTIWVVYSYRSVSVSRCLNMQTTNSKFWKRHLLISLSHYLSIYHHLCTHPLSLSLWGSHTAASCLCSPTTRLTYHLHGNEPTIFFLIVIGGMCDLSIKWWPGSCLLHRQTKVGGGQTRTLLKAPSSLSITFAASSSLHLCSRICLVQRIWLRRTTANTHKHCTNFASQHSVMLAHHPHFHNLLLLPDSTAFG